MADTSLTQLEKLYNLPDPLLAFRWVCTYLPFDLPPHYMEAIDLPVNNIAAGEQVYAGGKFFKFPGTHSLGSFTSTIYEDRNGRGLKWIEEWKSKVKNFKTGSYGLPKAYKQAIVVSLLDNKNNKVITARILGVWPTDTNPMSLNYTDGTARIAHQQTFEADDVELTFHR